MLFNPKTGAIIGIIALGLTIGFFVYQESKPPEVTTQTFAELLKEGNVKKFNELRKDWSGKLEFVGIDLSGMDLTGINLSSVTFTDANFHRIILAESNLEHMTFSGNLEESDLSDAFLSHANLSRTFLRDSNLSGASLAFSNLSNTNLYHVNFSGTILSKANLSGADLRHSNFEGSLLYDADLTNADLRHAYNLPIILDKAKERGAIVD